MVARLRTMMNLTVVVKTLVGCKTVWFRALGRKVLHSIRMIYLTCIVNPDWRLDSGRPGVYGMSHFLRAHEDRAWGWWGVLLVAVGIWGAGADSGASQESCHQNAIMPSIKYRFLFGMGRSCLVFCVGVYAAGWGVQEARVVRKPFLNAADAL